MLSSSDFRALMAQGRLPPPPWASPDDYLRAEFARNFRAWVAEMTTYDSFAEFTAAGHAAFARASSGFAMNDAGLWIDFAPGALRRTDRGALIEPAATNRCLYANDLTNAAYVLTAGAVKTANTIAAPDGSMTGDMLTYPDKTVAYQLYQLFPVAENTQYTFSYWAQLGSKLTNRYAIYNNTAGAWIIAETAAAGVVAGAWHRVSATFVTPAGCTAIRGYADRHAANLDGPDGNTIYIWGQQLELGAVASSPIPTAGLAVTRAADALTLNLPAGPHDLTFVFDNESEQIIAGASGEYPIDPSALNRPVVKSIIAKAAA